MSRKGRQVHLGSALNGIVGRLDRRSGGSYTATRAIIAWENISTGMAASHTTGAHLRDGTLVVYVDGNSWATHLSAMAEQFRAAVNEEIGEELVSEIRFTVSRKVAEEHRLKKHADETAEFYAADDVESIPLTEVELAQVEASVARIPGDELREAVLRATVKDLEWKKGLSAANSSEKRRESF